MTALLVALGLVLALAGKRKGAAPLGFLREFVLKAVAEVVPSSYGDERFARLAPGYSPKILETYPTFTTCGYLPAFVARWLGERGKLLFAGIELVRTEGKTAGCWRTPSEGRLPKPGDFYGLASSEGGILVHVGVVISANDREWVTADAGQGSVTAQRAMYVTRKYDAPSGRITSGTGTKIVAGWLDIECYPFDRKVAA
jgi:hypothetical protein